MIGEMVAQAVDWHWWLFVVTILVIGFSIGFAARGLIEQEWRREDAEMIQQREIELAKRRHPAYRTDRGTYFG